MDKKRKYAKFILRDCLLLKKGQPLLIIGPTITNDFIDLMMEEATELGITDIGVLRMDKFAQRDLLMDKSGEECIDHELFDRHLYNEYALKNAAFAFITSPIPHIFDGVDEDKISFINKKSEERVSIFREKQSSGEVPWCIFAVANDLWTKDILGDSSDSETLWETIYDICYINEENPFEKWNDYFKKLDGYATILNEMKIQSLHYTNTLGTDIIFELPENYRFVSGKESGVIVNMPTLELFTTPKKNGVNGIVYNTKPLFYSGVLIDDFSFTFKNGRIISVKASIGEETLKKMIETDEGSHYLGEIALVSFDSKINQSNIVFKETLYDENASCHLAIGRGFPEAIQNGLNMSLEELNNHGINYSLVHTDFMIGSRDLKIEAYCQNGTKKIIMEQGNIIISEGKDEFI